MMQPFVDMILQTTYENLSSCSVIGKRTHLTAQGNDITISFTYY